MGRSFAQLPPDNWGAFGFGYWLSSGRDQRLSALVLGVGGLLITARGWRPGAWLALDVSVANSCPESTGYSAGYFRLRVGDLPGEIVGLNRPVPSGDLQPALAEGTLPASPGPGLEQPRRRGWVTFADVPVYRSGPFFLDYVTPLDAMGDTPLPAPADPSACPPLRRISLPIQFQ